MKKRILSSLLALCILVSVFPLAASATPADASPPGNQTTPGLIRANDVSNPNLPDLAEAPSAPARVLFDSEPIYVTMVSPTALEGDYGVSLPGLFSQGFIAGSFHNVTLKPEAGPAITLANALYAAGPVKDEETTSAMILGIQNLSPGKYQIFAGDSTTPLSKQLRIVGKNEKVVLYTAGFSNSEGQFANYVPTQAESLKYDFKNGRMYSYGFRNTFSLFNRNNDILMAVYGYNISYNDITTAIIKDESGEPVATLKYFIPSTYQLDAGLTANYLLLKQLPGKDATTGKTLQLITADGVSVEASGRLNYSRNDRFWLDYSDIANLKVAVVTEEPEVSLPDTISVTLSKSSNGANIIGSPITATRQGDRYIINLPANTYFLEDYILYFSFDLNGERKTARLLSDDIAHISSSSEYLTEINNESFWVNPINRGYNAESAAFYLADSSFAPVNGVSITKYQPDTSFYSTCYRFHSLAPLTDGAIYYIMLGSLPLEKFTAKATLSPINPGETEPGIYGFGIFTSEYQGIDKFTLYLSAYDVAVNPAEFSFKLISALPGGKTYNINSTDSTPLLSYRVSEDYDGATHINFQAELTAIDPGPYNVEIYVNGVKQTSEQIKNLSEADCFIFCTPAKEKTKEITSLQFSEPFTTNFSSRFATLSGYGRSNSAADITGWKLVLYKTDNVFVTGDPIVVDIPAISPRAPEFLFDFDISSTVLKTAGITPGVWWTAVLDETGKVIFNDYLKFMSSFLDYTWQGYTLEGSISLSGDSVYNAVVELWKDGSRLQADTTTHYGWFKFINLEPGNYRIRVPRGSSYETYTSELINPEEITYLPNITLTPLVPGVSASFDPEDYKVKLTFTRGMAQGIENSLTVKSGDTVLTGTWERHPVLNIFIFNPDAPLTPGSTVTVTVPGNLESFDHYPIGEDKTLTVQVPTQRVIKGYVVFGDTGLTSIEIELWKDAVKVDEVTVTGELGRFEFYDIEPGSYTLRIPAGGNRAAFITQPIDMVNSGFRHYAIALSELIIPEVTAAYNSADKTIKLTFTKSMAQGIENSITVKSGGANINGSWSKNVDSTIYTFTPAVVFTPGSTVTITLPGTLKSAYDVPLGEDVNLTVQIPGGGSPGGLGGGGGGGSSDTSPTSTEGGTLYFSYPSKDSADVTVTLASVKDKTLIIETSGGRLIISPKVIASLAAIKALTKVTFSVKKGSFIVDILFNGILNVREISLAPLKIELNVPLKPGESPSSYIPVRKIGDAVSYIPKSAVVNGKIVFETPNIGTFDLIYKPKSFKDIPSGAWYEDAVRFAASRELFSGVGINNFAPDIGMTRGMFATVLAKLEVADLTKYDVSIYSDVLITDYYGKAVAWAADKGIMGGYGNGIFGPNDKITREQMAVILSNYIKYKGYVLPKNTSGAPFADQAKINPWAVDFVKDIQAMGIITGKSGNRYDPQGTATRAEVAAVFKKFVEVYFSA